MGVLREKYSRDLELKGYADSSVKAYVEAVAKFTSFYDKNPEHLGLEHVLKYQLHLTEERKLSAVTANISMAALRFLYLQTLERSWNPNSFRFVKKKRRVPVILSVEEVASLLNAIDNLQYRTLMLTLYAAGLRSNEAVHLQGSQDSKAPNS